MKTLIIQYLKNINKYILPTNSSTFAAHIKLKLFLFVLISLAYVNNGISQESKADTTKVFKGEEKKMTHEDLALMHSPKKATILSAVLPGAGQIYNKKYWKAPVIWIGISTALYVSQLNRALYQDFRNEYILELGYPVTQSQYHDVTTLAHLEDMKNSYKQQMETSYIVAGAIYVLQILDANVDAQLMSFNVSDDLSMNLTPNAISNQFNPEPVLGLTLCLNFK